MTNLIGRFGRVFGAIMVGVLLTGMLAACGSKAAVAEVFDDFKKKVRSGDNTGAWNMLTESSQRGFASQDEFNAVLAKLKDTVFAESTVIRGTSFEGGDKRMSTGTVLLMDENGTKTGEAGKFTAFDDNGKWKVEWTLTRTGESVSEVPGGAAGQ